MIKQVLESTSFFSLFKGSVEDLTSRWSEPHRYYHNLKHLQKILNQIENDKDEFSKIEYDILVISAIYHDIVCLPREDSLNVKESIEKFESDFLEDFSYKSKIIDIINSTNYHSFQDKDKLIRMFNSYDMNGILTGDLEILIKDGNNVAREFKVDKSNANLFKMKRIEFLEKYKKFNPDIQKCINYLKL